MSTAAKRAHMSGCNARIKYRAQQAAREQIAFPVQKSFGDFIKERVGPKWVYAQRNSERIASRYPGSVVILPKQQRKLAADYKRNWGQEYDKPAWKALCALRAVDRQQNLDVETHAMVLEAIEALTL